MRSYPLFALATFAACGHPPTMPAPLAPTDPSALARTVVELAAFGEKHVGTDRGHQAGSYVQSRFIAARLGAVHTESFQMQRFNLLSSSLAITIAGAASSPGYDVFEYSGSGMATGALVYVGTATDAELTGIDLTGKVALVDRSATFHRSAQYRNVAAKGATAMLYVSTAPQNLRQVGTVQLTWYPSANIPAITIGSDDGTTIRDAVKAGRDVRATLHVMATTVPSTGNNVIATLPGKEPSTIVIGAHYDSWFTGSSDNGGGVAAMLALAERRMKKSQPRYTLVFIGYDGEEIGLYGGYDYLRKHRIVGKEPLLAVINFEVPSAKMAQISALGRSNQGALDEALRMAELNQLYFIYGGLDLVPKIYGGVIPTDIQGLYRNGVPTVSTAVVPPFYHTRMDTPDTVDTAMLAQAVDEFDLALDTLLLDEASRFAEKDPKIWSATVTATHTAGSPVAVSATITTSTGATPPSAPAEAVLLVDDFSFIAKANGMTDAQGKVSFTFSGGDAAMGAGNRWIHVTAGPDYPLVEQIVPLP